MVGLLRAFDFWSKTTRVTWHDVELPRKSGGVMLSDERFNFRTN